MCKSYVELSGSTVTPIFSHDQPTSDSTENTTRREAPKRPASRAQPHPSSVTSGAVNSSVVRQVLAQFEISTVTEGFFPALAALQWQRLPYADSAVSRFFGENSWCERILACWPECWVHEEEAGWTGALNRKLYETHALVLGVALCALVLLFLVVA